MARIKTKVPGFTGVRASVNFINGVGNTDNDWLIGWFKNHEYIVEEETSFERLYKPLTIETTSDQITNATEERKTRTRRKG